MPLQIFGLIWFWFWFDLEFGNSLSGQTRYIVLSTPGVGIELAKLLLYCWVYYKQTLCTQSGSTNRDKAIKYLTYSWSFSRISTKKLTQTQALIRKGGRPFLELFKSFGDTSGSMVVFGAIHQTQLSCQQTWPYLLLTWFIEWEFGPTHSKTV